jgi:hypothetical protein
MDLDFFKVSGTNFPTIASQGYDFNTIRGFSTSGPVEYGFLENADNRPFYFAVSEVIREYLGARFGFDSLELTTDELCAELRRSAGRELGIHFTEIQGWLSASDLVKFAKVSPTAAESRGTLETAIRFVSSTKPLPPRRRTARSASAASSPSWWAR